MLGHKLVGIGIKRNGENGGIEDVGYGKIRRGSDTNLWSFSEVLAGQPFLQGKRALQLMFNNREFTRTRDYCGTLTAAGYDTYIHNTVQYSFS